jgi:two-component system, OmpR family, sensor histidine kinase ChvG
VTDRPRPAFAMLPTRLSARLLAFNLLLVFLPVAGFLYLDVYERQLLGAQERAMVQQGRLLAAALGGAEGLSAERARVLLARLGGRTEARLRVVGRDGALLADSARLVPPRALPISDRRKTYAPSFDTRESLLYRAGAALVRLVQRGPGPGKGVASEPFYPPGKPLLGPEVRAALAGRYGAATRPTGGQPSLTLYSAIPVRVGSGNHAEVAGAVLVSQSTSRILAALAEVRLGALRVVLASVAVAAALSLLVAATIARPLARLREEARALTDRRGRLRGSFRGSARRDEIGDLARALEELTRRLEAHLRFLENFAADVSHELKNPLAAVRGAAELLAEVEDPEERARFVGLVLQEVARMERLLSSLREVTEIDARLGEEPAEVVDLAALLRDLTEAARLRARRGVTVDLRVEAAPLPVLASPERLTRVFGNLFDNALDFSPDGGEVTVAAGAVDGTGPGASARVTVEDHGPGIPEAHRERVFDRFFSDRRGATDGSGGHSGLGLAIARAVIEGYGGMITASTAGTANTAGTASTAGSQPERGARFEVRLPLAGEAERQI